MIKTLLRITKKEALKELSAAAAALASLRGARRSAKGGLRGMALRLKISRKKKSPIDGRKIKENGAMKVSKEIRQ